jgi:hypothetical protein
MLIAIEHAPHLVVRATSASSLPLKLSPPRCDGMVDEL